ncbi:hypothetical protein K3217_18660 [bacterium BD-1]|nr:hypothetical protein [Ottowia caeni]
MPKSSPFAALCLLLPLAGCGGSGEDAAQATAPAVVEAAPAETGPDWSHCRFPGLALPVPARLFVVDGGTPDPGAEPGREIIRRVDIAVPGPVALLLTAPEATAWHVRPGPETELRAVIAIGDAPQRITGQRLGVHRLERSTAMGDACGGYLLRDGAGPALSAATEAIFGKPHDALYAMRIGSVVIGGTDPDLDQPVGH